MRTTLRFLLIAVAVIGLLGSFGFGAFSWWVMRKMGPDFWVALIEKDTNCRAHVDSAHISLFTRPATLKLSGVRLAPRDDEFLKPFNERRPLADSESPIVIPEVELEVKLEDLMSRRLQIQHLHISRPVVTETQDAQGHSSLEPLFSADAPQAQAAASFDVQPRNFEAPPPPLAPAPQRYGEVPRALPVGQAAPPPITAASPITAEPPPPEPKSADPSSFSIAVEAATIEEGTVTILSSDSTVNILNLNITVSGIQMQPVLTSQQVPTQITLAAEVNVNAMARIGGVKKPAEIAHLLLSGSGDVFPIDPRTGAWNPSTTLKLVLAKGSVLGGHVTMGDTAGKELRKLQEYGVDLRPVPIGGPLLEEALVNGVFANNQFTLTTPTRFAFPEYELVIEPNSWLNSAKDQHLMRVHLSCGPGLQQRLQTGIAQAKLGDSIARAVTKALSDERGRMTFDIVSSGSLSNPEVKPSIDRVLNNLLRGQGLGDLLQGLLKKL